MVALGRNGVSEVAVCCPHAARPSSKPKGKKIFRIALTFWPPTQRASAHTRRLRQSLHQTFGRENGGRAQTGAPGIVTSIGGIADTECGIGARGKSGGNHGFL